MNVCQEHWDLLRAAVEVRGMTHLVARSGQEAAADMVAQLEGRSSLDNWDPLMAAHWPLAGKIMERVGLAALALDFCYLCAIQQSYDWYDKEDVERPPEALAPQGWVDSCMDAMLEYAREQGLMPRVS